jgi:response regulator RpfG family c-di-GMP phosphodiesterase
MESIANFIIPFLITVIILFVVLGTLSQYHENYRNEKDKNSVQVLIVDDNGKDLANVWNALRRKYQITLASNVEAAKSLLVSEQPKYALIDLNLSGEDKNEFDGVKLFKFIFEKKLTTKPVVVSAYSFEHAKPSFEALLKDLPDNKFDSSARHRS